MLSIKSTIEAEGFIPFIPDTRTRYLLASDWFITSGNWTEWSSINNEIKWRTELEIKFLVEMSQMLPENCQNTLFACFVKWPESNRLTL